MKMTRRERKAYKLGKLVGYADGYAKGLHDGNPFTLLAETMSEFMVRLSDMVTDPEFIELCKACKEQERTEENEEETYDE